MTDSKEPPTNPVASPPATQKLQDKADALSHPRKRALPSIRSKQSSQSRPKTSNHPICSLTDNSVAQSLERLMAEFGWGTSSSFLDDTYSIYMPNPEQAAICFKVIKKVAIMYGDPLCAAGMVETVFGEFQRYCRKQGWHVAVVGARPALTQYAQKHSWRTMEVAVEQVLNPMTNAILDETAGKTITRTNRKLVASGVKLHLYDPRNGRRPDLEHDLLGVYKAWTAHKAGKRNAAQAYSAIINPFGMPAVSRYMYTCGDDGRPNSLAGIIQLGSNGGYLLEPCIQLPDAPKGITGFLVTHVMGMLRDEGVTYMTFGFEALPEIGDISHMPSFIDETSRRFYRSTFNSLGLMGRKTFHESFYPESKQNVPLCLLFPPGMPRMSVYQAVLEATHVSPIEVWRSSRALKAAKAAKQAQDKPKAGNESAIPVE